MRRPLALGAAALSLLAVLPACSNTKRPPQTSPLLADLVDYRAALDMLHDGRADEAISLLLRARAVNPHEPAVPNALGLALLYKKEHASALKAFNDALAMNPDYVEARNNRGVCYMEQGRFEEAEADFGGVLDSGDTTERPKARYNLGMVQEKREKWADAEREFSLVLTDDPLYRSANRERGLVRMRTLDFRGALEDFLTVLKADPKDVVSNYQAALCLISQGRRDLALRYMERTVSLSPESDEGKRARRFVEGERSLPAEPEGIR